MAQIEHCQSKLLGVCIERMNTDEIDGVEKGTVNFIEKIAV